LIGRVSRNEVSLSNAGLARCRGTFNCEPRGLFPAGGRGYLAVESLFPIGARPAIRMFGKLVAGIGRQKQSKFRGTGAKLDRERNDVPCGLQPHDYRYDFFPTGRERCTCNFHIRCRGQRTDLLVSTEGSWRASRANELQVDLRVNDQPAIRMQWIASSDGRTAIFKDDAVRFLRSLPDGGRIMVSVSDSQGTAHAASFQLTGLDVIRQKIAVACKWTPAPDRVAPAGR
jgi:hypothetical protein